jgi:hypothetical protein
MNEDQGKGSVPSARKAKGTRLETSWTSNDRAGGPAPFDPAPEWLDALRDSLSQMGPVQGVRMRPGPC